MKKALNQIVVTSFPVKNNYVLAGESFWKAFFYING